MEIAEDTVLDIVLEPGLILSGRVASPDGTPVAGVVIMATDWLENLRAFGTTSTDGTYRIALAPGIYMLEIEPPEESSFLPRTVFDLEIANDTTFDIAVDVGAILSGYITNREGMPIANVFVGVWGTEDVNQAGRGVTSTDGSYSIANLRPDTYRLEIRPSDDSPLAGQIITDVPITEDTSFDVELPPAASLFGKVTDSDGEPVAGIVVQTVEPGGYGITTSDGAYHVRLLPGSYTLSLWSADSGEFLSQTISDVQVVEETHLDITLKPSGFVLSGHVTDEGEGMIDGSMVVAHKLPTSSLWPFGTPYRSGIEVDGRYQLTLEEGRYDVTFGHYIREIFSGRRIPDVEVSKDMALDVALPSLAEAFEVRGIVRGRAGDPMSEVDISAYDENTGSFSTAISGAGGTYALALPSGTYDFTLNDHRVAHSLTPADPQFPEQFVKDVVVEGNTVRNIAIDLSAVTLVGEDTDLPSIFALEENYPNPFNNSTAIRFSVPASEEVELAIFNLVGQKVVTLLREGKEAGTYVVGWDGLDDRGHHLGSGVYLYRMKAGTRSRPIFS